MFPLCAIHLAMSERDSRPVPNPNFILPPRAKRGGLSDKRRAPPHLDPLDVQFVEEKRALGISDAEIAKMLGCSTERIRRNVLTDATPKQAEAPLESTWKGRVPYISDGERRRRNASARGGYVWRAESKTSGD